MIHAIDHVNLVVRDLQAMTAFYRDRLGLKVTKQVRISGPWIDAIVGLKGVDADVVYLEFPGGGPRIELIHYRAPSRIDPPNLDQPHARGLRHVAFQVADIDSLVRSLTAAGVRFVSPVQQVPDAQVTYAGGVRKRLIYFRDPEENLLELCEYKVNPPLRDHP